MWLFHINSLAPLAELQIAAFLAQDSTASWPRIRKLGKIEPMQLKQCPLLVIVFTVGVYMTWVYPAVLTRVSPLQELNGRPLTALVVLSLAGASPQVTHPSRALGADPSEPLELRQKLFERTGADPGQTRMTQRG